MRSHSYARRRLAGDGEPLATLPASLTTRLGALGKRLTAWIETCASYYASAALYEELARLSDAELNRRGLTRATLAWDIAQACDRSSG
jgi:hypothetical protein